MHWNGFSFSWTIAIWFLSSLGTPNLVGHKGHCTGLFFSWTREMCLLRVPFTAKPLKHMGHWKYFSERLETISRTFLTTFPPDLTIVSDISSVRVALKILNIYFFSSWTSARWFPSWTIDKCLFKEPFDTNFWGQKAHS